ncbi:hypothetical protein OGAPHI_003068 [Ogataea philodendri]|uniref:Uncharacterized protein n=1 Tax=Ogataea philodendri TaxID=1378263 RepID=A0A9P8P9K1_9ASCO|nr:uncharacterized protein OGAPHI_003068 [Ogataea philodendri]KAH3667419.1 hypothetical protein OGAPHI_003068 [Ogataea philodendri]
MLLALEPGQLRTKSQVKVLDSVQMDWLDDRDAEILLELRVQRDHKIALQFLEVDQAVQLVGQNQIDAQDSVLLLLQFLELGAVLGHARHVVLCGVFFPRLGHRNTGPVEFLLGEVKRSVVVVVHRRATEPVVLEVLLANEDGFNQIEFARVGCGDNDGQLAAFVNQFV